MANEVLPTPPMPCTAARPTACVTTAGLSCIRMASSRSSSSARPVKLAMRAGTPMNGRGGAVEPPTIVQRTVGRRPNAELRPREYLTEKEVERLIEAARKHGRYSHRDATAILLAYRHGL